MQQILPDAEVLQTFGQLSTFALIMLFLCIVATGMVILMFFLLRTFKSTTDGLRDTNRNMADSMKDQQVSSDKREDKLAAAITLQAQEASKIARVLLLINSGVHDTQTHIDDTQTAFLYTLSQLNSERAQQVATETDDIKTALQEIFDTINTARDDVLAIKRVIDTWPGKPPDDVQKQLDLIVGYLERMAPKLATGTFRQVTSPVNNISEVADITSGGN